MYHHPWREVTTCQQPDCSLLPRAAVESVTHTQYFKAINIIKLLSLFLTTFIFVLTVLQHGNSVAQLIMPPRRIGGRLPSRGSSALRQRRPYSGRAPNPGPSSFRDSIPDQISMPAAIQTRPSSPSTFSSAPSPNAGFESLDEGFDIEDDVSETDEVVMALEMRTNGAVGCAFYVAASETLYLQEDTRITGVELVESLLLQAHPATVIIPSRSPESFVDFLERQSHRDDAGMHGKSFFESPKFEVLKHTIVFFRRPVC